MIDEDAVLERLKSLEGQTRAQRRECGRLLQAAEPVARKARWAYAHYLSRTGRAETPPANFVEKFLASWRDSILHLVNEPGRIEIEMPEDVSKTLFVCWHFPEHPLLLRAAVTTNTLVLVASERKWMEDLIRHNCLFCFRANAYSTALPRAFYNGRSVFAMLDYCYETSHHVVSPFLSYPARTPTGVLEFASKYGYQVCVVSIRRRRLKVVETIQVGGLAVEDLVRRVNQRIEDEILKRPDRWLLWPSVPQRWIDVDYGDAA